MSRINDELKRAKRVQRDNPGLPPPKLIVAPPTQAQPRKSDFPLMMLLALAAILVLGGAFVAYALFKQSPAPVAVNTPPPVAPPPPPPPAAPPAKVEPVAPPAPVAKPVVAAPPIVPNPPAPVVTTLLEPPPKPAPAVPPTSKPALPVLQGVFYRSDKPTAIISGKTVRPGARIGDFQVLAISPNTVTIGNATQTNVLKMPE